MLMSIEGSRNNESQIGTALVHEIYHLKQMAIEVVVPLAMDLMRLQGDDCTLTRALHEQMKEEMEHLHACRKLLLQRGALGEAPAFVRIFHRIMRRVASSGKRTVALAAATQVCTCVERLSFAQMSTVKNTDVQSRELLQKLHADEEGHFSLVADRITPIVTAEQSLRARWLANFTVWQISCNTLFRWWPKHVRHYTSLGLDLHAFVDVLLMELGRSLPPLGIFFPTRLIRRFVFSLPFMKKRQVKQLAAMHSVEGAAAQR